ncbi:MAG: transcriptional regulator NrdR [Nanoarchaeota archaeon]
MLCPYCKNNATKVTNKRSNFDVIRRRRECLKCKRRFTTYERLELELKVIKKDNLREKFDRNKLKLGIEKAFEKRPVSSDEIEKIVEEIQLKIYNISKGKEIKSSKIGQLVMDRLEKIDKIAYIRFASVYREFKDLGDFKNEIKKFA